jgi:hypothetical protein
VEQAREVVEDHKHFHKDIRGVKRMSGIGNSKELMEGHLNLKIKGR